MLRLDHSRLLESIFMPQNEYSNRLKFTPTFRYTITDSNRLKFDAVRSNEETIY